MNSKLATAVKRFASSVDNEAFAAAPRPQRVLARAELRQRVGGRVDDVGEAPRRVLRVEGVLVDAQIHGPRRLVVDEGRAPAPVVQHVVHQRLVPV